MLELGVANSRMKDFYDLQVLSSRLAFERHAAPLYARILRRHKQEKTVDGVLRKECNLHGKDGIRHRHRNTEDLFPSRLWQLCARELCSHYSGSPRCLARNKCTQNRAKTWLPVLRAGYVAINGSDHPSLGLDASSVPSLFHYFILLRCFDQRPSRYSFVCWVILSRILTSYIAICIAAVLFFDQ